MARRYYAEQYVGADRRSATGWRMTGRSCRTISRSWRRGCGIRRAQMAPNQPGAASKLRDALNGMDQSDLTNRVQRTADWLRQGIDPNSNGTEAGIATDCRS